MINLDDYANEHKTEHNLKWPYIPDALLNLINNQPDVDKIYLYAKYPYEANINF